MQRPKSEGQTGVKPWTPQLRSMNALSRSMDASAASRYDLSGSEDEDTKPRASRPRRPLTTPKARIQRFVLGPGQTHVQEAQQAAKHEIFMTHLPDSPPRQYSTQRKVPVVPLIETSSAQTAPVAPDDDDDDATSMETPGDMMDEEASPRRDESGASEDDRESVEASSDSLEASMVEPLEGSTEDRPEVHESTDLSDSSLKMPVIGPMVMDVRSVALDVDDATRDPADDFPEHDEDEEAYRHLQEVRVQIAEEEERREQVRQELVAYVSSLTSRRDDDGQEWLTFPRNYQQILSLMTERDIREEEEEDASSASSRVSTAGASERQKSWSRVLIQDSLSKQQAYGVLDESEDGANGEGSLATKIALKMARIRQLDAVLEAKLGKDIYDATPLGKKTKPRQSAATSHVNAPKQRAFVTQPESITKEDLLKRMSDNAVPKNNAEGQKLIGNAAKMNLSRDEELRLQRLLREGDNSAGVSTKEYQMEESAKAEIERLLEEKRGAYQSALLEPMEEILEEEPETQGPTSSAIKRKPNVVQEIRRDRLRKQRLQKIDEELKFLQANEAIPILPDDEEGDCDDTRSEQSYVTTTSMLSTCSTRSGITRRQLNQFVAMEMHKTESATPRASPDEIQYLLRSLSHLSMSRPATMTV
ncbi:hypothetical protein Poli38472_009250 [Pythium oligandrum]|uniref:Fibrous sheath-interacting protein 1 n=1 Tax=Pythium oligandrum TaxID=41045 RepID=A0A8K1FNY0_PYTOL|nr:hypothetical protein Poli38472_009250 [Pythium oligandrum]|eukprot:TMW65083.1 hypothetical protein Poli38472_009250 [Pythium oligandrum]